MFTEPESEDIASTNDELDVIIALGHLKLNHRLDSCFLKSRVGDRLNLIGSVAGFSVLKLLRLLALGRFFRALSAGSVFIDFLDRGRAHRLPPRRFLQHTKKRKSFLIRTTFHRRGCPLQGNRYRVKWASCMRGGSRTMLSHL